MAQVGMSNERNREEWLGKTLAQIPAGSRILDAGAGEQKYKRFCSQLDYVSQDFAQYNGKGDGKGMHTGTWNQSKLDIISDITVIPEPDASFDAIMCIEVLEHLPEPINAINEFYRLLKPGGKLIITSPFCSLTHFAPYHFYSGFNRYFYEIHLKNHGFEIIELKENGNYFEYIAQEIRRIPSLCNLYPKDRMNFFEKVGIKIILKMLERFSRKDSDSRELLCFGYHMLAIKR